MDSSEASMRQAPWLNIVFPVRNEEARLEVGIKETIAFFDESGFDDYALTIVDNDSTDDTFAIADRLKREYPRVSYIRIEEKGVGAAFRAAVHANESPIIGYMDIDLATDLRHLLEVIQAFQQNEELQFINGSRWANGYGSTGRGIKRTVTSMGLTAVLKSSLKMKASDAICGFKFFRKEPAEKLIGMADATENGWFFIIEMLLIAERAGMNVYELPVDWTDDGHSSVEVVSVIRDYLNQIVRLRKRFKSTPSNYVRIG